MQPSPQPKCWDLYVSTATYPPNSRVSYNGLNWVSLWTVDAGMQPPGDGGWIVSSACGSHSECLPGWSNTADYPQHSQVSYAETNWYTEEHVPAGQFPPNMDDGRWLMLGSCLAAEVSQPRELVKRDNNGNSTSQPECYPNYTVAPFAGIAYNKGDFASYQGFNYVAAVQGPTLKPGTGSDWILQGPCKDDSFMYRPFTTPGIIGYWTQWSPYSRNQNSIRDLDLNGLTSINYAFVNVLATGNLTSFDTWADFNWMRVFTAQRYKYPQLKAIASIGGWSGSKTFSVIAASPSVTATFAKNVHEFLDSTGFDGIDLDWEYPGGGGLSCNSASSDDAANFANLLEALRNELGPNRTISIAVSGEVSRYASNGVSFAQKYLNVASYVQIMSYDFYGPWVPFSDFHSGLHNPGPSDQQQPVQNNIGYSRPMSISSAIAEWKAAGASSSQLVAGLAFYGRSWQVQSNDNNGLYQECLGSVNGNACAAIVGDYLDEQLSTDACGGSSYSGVWMYMNLRGAVNSPSGNSQTSAPLPFSDPTVAGNNWSREYVSFADNPSLYSSNYRGKPTFIGYDDPTSIEAKASYLKNSELGGAMVWELSLDFNAELVDALLRGWKNGS
ncbi:hypothetical protein HDU82_009153 [Entophlyctis luteolus]|nr:hypothetical protein HDU82_009153 [Entophlyctis luteolus]